MAYTEAQKDAILKYLAENTDDVRLRVPKGLKKDGKLMLISIFPQYCSH